MVYFKKIIFFICHDANYTVNCDNDSLDETSSWKILTEEESNQGSGSVFSGTIKKGKKWDFGLNNIKTKVKKMEKKDKTFSTKSSILIYKLKNNHILETANFVDQVRPISDNQVTLGRHKLHELCLRKISHR